MAAEIYIGAVTDEYDRLLRGISSIAKWSLWLRPQAGVFVANEVEGWLRSFQPLRCIVWRSASGDGRLPTIGAKLRSFGDWPQIAKQLFFESTIRLASGVTVYADACWADPDVSASLAAFLTSTMAAVDSHVSFIPQNDEDAFIWVSTVYPLVSAWLKRSNSKQISSDAAVDGAVLRYIEATTRIGGIAGLSWDVDARRGLVLFGDRALLEAAVLSMPWQPSELTKEVFERWYTRGLHFCVCP